MKSVPLTAYSRAATRRAGAKKLREDGRVPAVIYGRKAPPQNLEVERTALEDLVHHSASEILLVDLAVAEDARPQRLALVQEIQHHPLSGKMLHIDFHEVSENEKVTVSVPVEAQGEAAGVKAGGILEHVMFKLRVRCLPKDLPDVINVDVTHVELNKAVHIGEIVPPPGCQILGDKHLTVLAVAAPLTEEQEQALAAEAEGTTATDVEMIKEKKEEGEEGATEKPAGKGAEKGPAKGAAPAEKAPAGGAKTAAGAAKAPAGAAAGAPAAEKKPAGKK
jgi:large subunit ribosomal protein L25